MIGVAGVKRWEEEKDQVNLYFEELSTRRQCVGFLVVQETQVENPLPAIVRIYDYYQQELSVSAVSYFCLSFLTLTLGSYEKSVVFWVITRRRVVIIYHTTLCNYPEDHRLHQHRGGSLKSRFI
jgi:hypothetical protein